MEMERTRVGDMRYLPDAERDLLTVADIVKVCLNVCMHMLTTSYYGHNNYTYNMYLHTREYVIAEVTADGR